ncbi:uncharacterized protein An02g07810 [Aspergillus niger]|uniref:Contig An02c0240, genomic contig n=2 Tax=Aspergillus niger TaxID=5061 RepID=A2QDP3_ASPNC|nr:uncharacterized protein An02g07810 [Aspergillus niger]CAK37744.1 unnamed protein product [Aspergillus niger]
MTSMTSAIWDSFRCGCYVVECQNKPVQELRGETNAAPHSYSEGVPIKLA